MSTKRIKIRKLVPTTTPTTKSNSSRAGGRSIILIMQRIMKIFYQRKRFRFVLLLIGAAMVWLVYVDENAMMKLKNKAAMTTTSTTKRATSSEEKAAGAEVPAAASVAETADEATALTATDDEHNKIMVVPQKKKWILGTRTKHKQGLQGGKVVIIKKDASSAASASSGNNNNNNNNNESLIMNANNNSNGEHAAGAAATSLVQHNNIHPVPPPVPVHGVPPTTTTATNYSWPSLSSMIDDPQNIKKANITSNVEHLLNFAIIGHPKTATTYVMRWLARHTSQIQIYTHEIHSLTFGYPGEFVAKMYNLSIGGTLNSNYTNATTTNNTGDSGIALSYNPRNYIRGYKAPRDIQDKRVLRQIRRYWPNAGLIVGLRHPILWFESFYNYRVHQNKTIPPANAPIFLNVSNRIGQCYYKEKVKYMCTDGALYQNHLSLLGKTNMSTSDERDLIRPRPVAIKNSSLNFKKMTNRVFLYEQSQLSDTNATRQAWFRRDLAQFLGMNGSLREELRLEKSKPNPSSSSTATATAKKTGVVEGEKPAVVQQLTKNITITNNTNANTPTVTTVSTTNYNTSNYNENATIRSPINICDDAYIELRTELMMNARTASLWIRNYFLKSPDVFVSSPNYFNELLNEWMIDPCIERNKKKQTKRPKTSILQKMKENEDIKKAAAATATAAG